MSLKAAVTLSRAVGASARPLLALRSVGAELAAAAVHWRPLRVSKPQQGPSLERHASSVAGSLTEGPRKASEVLPSTAWWTELEESQQEKLLTTFDGLYPQGRVAKLTLAALERLKTAPAENLLQALVSSGFVAQVDFGIRFENVSTEKQIKVLASLLDMPIDVSLKLAHEGKLISSIGMGLFSRVTQVWAKKNLPTYLSQVQAKLLEIESKQGKVEEQEATDREVQVCKEAGGDELWETLKRCGVVKTALKLMQGAAKAEDRVKVLKSLCSHSVDSLAKCDVDAFCKEELPEHVSASMVSDFKAALGLAVRTAWFDSQARALEVVNLAVPLRALLLLKKRGEDAAKKQLQDAGVVDEQFIQRLLNTDEATLEALTDNFGWMIDAGDAFRRQKATVWDVFEALMTGLAEEQCLPNAEEGEKGINWTPGCSPIFMDGILEAVVLRLPAWRAQPFCVGHDETGLTKVPFGDLSLQGLRPTTFGIRPESPSTMPPQDLSVTTYVLTRGRMMLFVKAAKTCFGIELGVLTTAPHGTGKSASLRALALMASVGAGGDVMYLPKSEVLVPGKGAFKELPRSLMQGGFALSCARSLKKPELCQDMASIGLEGADAHEALERTMIRGGSVYHHTGQQVGNFDCPSLLIIDEANSVQVELHRRSGELRADDQPADEGGRYAEWWHELEELFQWGGRSSKVLAFSPDVNASISDKGVLKPLEELFNVGSFRDLLHPFCEMEAMMPELALRLMLGPKDGKNSLGWSKKVDVVADMPAGQDCSLQLPPRAMEALRTKSNLKLLKDFIYSVDGVAGPLGHASELARSSAIVGPASLPSAVRQAWAEERGEMEKRCLERLQALSAENLLDRKQSVPMLLAHTLAAASILSRIHPSLLKLNRNFEFASHTARHALMRALLRRQRELAGSNADQETKDAWKRLLNGVAHLGGGKHFEHTVATLLEMGMFGSGYTPLSHIVKRKPVEMLGSCFFKGTNAFSKAQTTQAPEDSGLSAADVHAVQTLKPGSVHVVRTPHNFPAVDFVAFRRPPLPSPGKDLNEAKLEVAFIETTVSSLVTHGQNHILDRLVVFSGRSFSMEEVVLPQSLRDIADLACEVKYFTDVEGSRMKIRESKRSGRDTTTMANAILWTFGVPIDLNCTVHRDLKKEFDELLMEPRVLSGASRSKALANAARLLETQTEADEGDAEVRTPGLASRQSLDGGHADERTVAVEARGSGARTVEVKEELENLPLAATIQDCSDVEFFFIYCTPQPRDKESHSLFDAKIPGFFGVFEQGLLPPGMKTLDVAVPALEKD